LLARNKKSGYGAMCIYKKSSEQISQINIICAMHENTTYKPFLKQSTVCGFYNQSYCIVILSVIMVMFSATV
jgi:hypothetical protein